MFKLQLYRSTRFPGHLRDESCASLGKEQSLITPIVGSMDRHVPLIFRYNTMYASGSEKAVEEDQVQENHGQRRYV